MKLPEPASEGKKDIESKEDNGGNNDDEKIFGDITRK